MIHDILEYVNTSYIARLWEITEKDDGMCTAQKYIKYVCVCMFPEILILEALSQNSSFGNMQVLNCNSSKMIVSQPYRNEIKGCKR